MTNEAKVLTNNEELVKVENNQVVTDSRSVAEHFGKRHDNVSATIGGLLKNQETQQMFYKTTYVNEQNGQEYPMYLMNRDGFSLLVMGFTGKKALEWKLKYIKAFNSMEEKLKKKSTDLVLPDFTNPAEAARAWADQYERSQKLLAENKVLKPMADYADRILAYKGSVPVTVIAKDYGMSAIAFNRLLRDFHIIYRVGKRWFLYAKYQDEGYTYGKTYEFYYANGEPGCDVRTEWTQKGRLFLYNFLKEHNILPLIEKNQ